MGWEQHVNPSDPFFIVYKPDVSWAHNRKVKRVSHWVRGAAGFKFEESNVGWSYIHLFYLDELRPFLEERVQ